MITGQLKTRTMSELEKIEGISDSVKQYVQLNYEIIKLEATNKTSEIGSSIFASLIIRIVFILFVLTLTLGAGFYLSTLLGDTFSGFLIIAGFYLLISIILLVGRKKLLDDPIRDNIIRKLLANKKA